MNITLNSETVAAIHAELGRLAKEHGLGPEVYIEVDYRTDGKFLNKSEPRVNVWSTENPGCVIVRTTGADAEKAIANYKAKIISRTTANKERIAELRAQADELESKLNNTTK